MSPGPLTFDDVSYLVEVELVLSAVVPLAFFLTFFLWVFFEVLLMVVSVEVFWTFLAAGAAIRNGTATTVNRLDANNFFIVFVSLVSGAFGYSTQDCVICFLDHLLSAFSVLATAAHNSTLPESPLCVITSSSEFLSRI